MRRRSGMFRTLAMLTAFALAGCSGGSGMFSGASGPQPAPVEMTGRWLLAATNAPPCGVNFSGSRSEGSMAPEGGCPGNFFTSRRWSYEQDALIIRDHNGEQLASLKHNGARFEGAATNGMQITLTR